MDARGWAQLARLSALKRLDVDLTDESLADLDLRALIPHWNHFETLRVISSVAEGSTFLQNIPPLKNVVLVHPDAFYAYRSCPSVTRVSKTFISSRRFEGNNLRRLRSINLIVQGEDHFRTIVRHCRELEEIFLQNSELAADDFGILAEACRGLKNLMLVDCRGITQEGFLALATLPHLETLNVVNDQVISDAILEELAFRRRKLGHPPIQKITCYGCENISESVLRTQIQDGVFDLVRQPSSVLSQPVLSGKETINDLFQTDSGRRFVSDALDLLVRHGQRVLSMDRQEDSYQSVYVFLTMLTEQLQLPQQNALRFGLRDMAILPRLRQTGASLMSLSSELTSSAPSAALYFLIQWGQELAAQDSFSGIDQIVRAHLNEHPGLDLGIINETVDACEEQLQDFLTPRVRYVIDDMLTSMRFRRHDLADIEQRAGRRLFREFRSEAGQQEFAQVCQRCVAIILDQIGLRGYQGDEHTRFVLLVLLFLVKRVGQDSLRTLLSRLLR